ncbi:carbohydrate ABC transporter substrate-binding protein, partial [Yersinia enterocolitica]|nr:carbohydrate ABC transporter substrate-binding protein [Yersinia enterocolitica]
MKKAILHTLIASTLALLSHQAFAAQDEVNLRMSWWGGNGRHQVTLK